MFYHSWYEEHNISYIEDSLPSIILYSHFGLQGLNLDWMNYKAYTQNF